MKITALLMGSILLAPLFVNASPLVDHQQFSEFIKQAEGHSTPDHISPGMGAFLAIPAGTPIEYGEIDEKGASDGLDHEYQLILSSAGAVTHVLFRVGQVVTPDRGESYFFKLNQAGLLERVALARVAYKNGSAIRGSGRSEVLKVDAPVVKPKLKHELDFWLKGMYRKKKSSRK